VLDELAAISNRMGVGYSKSILNTRYNDNRTPSSPQLPDEAGRIPTLTQASELGRAQRAVRREIWAIVLATACAPAT